MGRISTDQEEWQGQKGGRSSDKDAAGVWGRSASTPKETTWGVRGG